MRARERGQRAACASNHKVPVFLDVSQRAKLLVHQLAGGRDPMSQASGPRESSSASPLPVSVRAHMTGLERDGVIRKVGRRPGTTRPSYIFELTPEVEQRLSRAYVPVLSERVRGIASGLPAEKRNKVSFPCECYSRRV
jgi:hypothetical protein